MSEDDHGGVRYRNYLEGTVTGLAYAGALAALSVFVVGSFRPGQLASPYWDRIGRLRTDTFGFVCFFMATVSFAWSEFLRLSRVARHRSEALRPDAGSLPLLALATARASAVASSALVAYLSVNAVTHPQTLGISATHLFSWPTESTLRAAALILTACAVAVAWTLRITTGHPGHG